MVTLEEPPYHVGRAGYGDSDGEGNHHAMLAGQDTVTVTGRGTTIPCWQGRIW